MKACAGRADAGRADPALAHRRLHRLPQDGKKLKMLKRPLMAAYGMTPEAYRAKWGLPHDYPMVAPSYAARRQELAKAIGLGRKPKIPPPATTRRAARKPRGD